MQVPNSGMNCGKILSFTINYRFKGAMASFNGRTCGCSYCVLCVLRQIQLFMLIIYAHLTPHLHYTHPFTSIFHYNSYMFPCRSIVF